MVWSRRLSSASGLFSGSNLLPSLPSTSFFFCNGGWTATHFWFSGCKKRVKKWVGKGLAGSNLGSKVRSQIQSEQFFMFCSMYTKKNLLTSIFVNTLSVCLYACLSRRPRRPAARQPGPTWPSRAAPPGSPEAWPKQPAAISRVVLPRMP